VFTSPPYFAAEGYSDEATQSYIKFPSYEEWLDGFLAPTLKTCVDYLKEERWLLWNISDVVLSSSYLPLESDTIKILESLGLEYRGVLKMALATAPGGNRDTKDGVPRTKNYCRIDDNIKKFEPILTFWKPIQKGKKKAKGWVPTFRWLLEQEERGQDDLTPIEEGDGIWLKRDDLYETAGVKGGKARSCWHLAHGAKGLVTAGSRESPQVNIVAHIAAELGIGCRCHVPSGPLLPEVEAAKRVGADIVQHRPGYNSVIKARARSDARSRGWREIPFGMECDEAIEQTALQVKKIPKEVERIVVPVGSGMSLAGILHGLYRNKLNLPVLVSLSAPIQRSDLINTHRQTGGISANLSTATLITTRRSTSNFQLRSIRSMKRNAFSFLGMATCSGSSAFGRALASHEHRPISSAKAARGLERIAKLQGRDNELKLHAGMRPRNLFG